MQLGFSKQISENLIEDFLSTIVSNIKQEKKFIMNGGKLIIPLPIFHIIDKNNYKYFVNKELGELGYSI